MNNCYLCGGTACHSRGVTRDLPEVDVLECDDCGLVFLSSFDHIKKSHYEQSAMHGDAPLPVEQWLLETDADDERRYRFLRQALPGRRLLDFGCGVGGFLLKARQLAAVVEGIEPELRLQSHFNQQGLKVATGLDGPQAGGGYDLITAFHVVEHLPDPRAVLTQLAARLKTNGELIVEVPSASDALLTLLDCKAFGQFTYWSQYLFLFNAATLTEVVSQAGLELRWLKQVQRYPLSNHLHWLSRGKPGGHQKWAFLDSLALNEAYSAQLAALGQCDTLLAGIGPRA